MNPSRSLPSSLPLSSPFSRALSRGLSALLALSLAGGALALVVGNETPRGALVGHVTDESGTLKLGKARVVLAPANDREASRSELDDSPFHTIRVTADERGVFQLASVPAGDYYLSATTKAHESTGDQQLVSVSEGETAQASLRLKRSQPALALAQNQKTFVPGEKVVLPVRGYVTSEVKLTSEVKGTKPETAAKPVAQLVALTAPTASTKPDNTLRLRVWKTRLSDIMLASGGSEALRVVGDRWSEPHAIPAALLNLQGAPKPKLLSDTRTPIRSADSEGFFHEKLALPSQPGLYLAQVDHAGIAACAWVQVGATALVTKKAGGTLLAFAADVRNGAPRPGFTVRALRDGKAVTSGVTDAQGIVQLDVSTKRAATTGDSSDEESRTEGEESEGESSSLLVVATRNGAGAADDESAIQSSDYNYEERGDYSVATLTDRPIYRPGQKIFYKGIARKVIEKGARYEVPNNEPVEVELRDPDGNRVLREARNANEFGSFWGRAELSPEAPSGTYTLITTVAGEEHTQDVTVASYRKPEFSVTVQPTQKRYTRGDTVEAVISAQYFFGAPVAGAKVHYDVLHEADWASEYADGDYDELDEADSDAEYGGSYGEVETSGDIVLDGQGRATLRLPSINTDKKEDEDSEDGYDSEYEPQADKWTISAYVTDTAGREQEGEGIARITQGAYRVFVEPSGSLAQPGQPLPITLRALDYDGKPVAGVQLQLKAALYQQPKKDDKDAEESDGYDTVFAARSATTDASGATVTEIKPPRVGEARLTVESTDKAGHALSSQEYVYVVGKEDDAYGWDWGTDNSLTLVADKRHYKAGETARVMLGAAQPGQVALLTIEGSGIYKAWTVPLKGHATVVQVPVKDDYGPNVYLAACTLHDKQLSKAQTPLRIDTSAHDISVKVTPDSAQGAPGGQAGFSVQTTDTSGKPVACDVALGVVDEGIYAMKEDDPKLLRDTFYPRREDGVSTNFSLDVEYLGEGDKADPVIQARRKFEDTAFWLPSLQTDATGRAHVDFKLPDNLTTWRATAWAQSKGSAFGRSTGAILETKPFFVRLETPRFWVDGDNSRVLATIHNTTAQEQNATVKLEANGLQVEGDNQTVTIPAGGSQTVTWPATPQLTGVNANGDALLKLSAWTDNRALTDAVEQMVPVQAHGRPSIDTGSGRVTGSLPASMTVNLPSNTVPQASRLTVRIAPTLAGSLNGALDYLTGFPYGCVEQTLSRFVPDLALEGLLRGNRADTQRRALLSRMVNNGVMRLSRFQHDSGGWGWWENDSDDAWMTAYALYGLTEARQQGYTIRPDMIENGVEGGSKLVTQIRGNAKAWQSDRQAIPFLLWSLSNASEKGKAFAAKIRPSIKITPFTTNEELAYLVMLDKDLGTQPSDKLATSPEAIKTAFLDRMTSGDDGRLYWKGADKYEGDRMATALGLRALLALDPNDERAASVLLWLLGHRTGDYWESTRDTSITLLATTDYLRLHPEATDLTGTIKVSLNGRDFKTLTLSTAMLREAEIAVPVPWQKLQKGANTLQITREGGQSPAFYTYEMRTVGEAQELQPFSSGQMNVKREYLKVLPLKNGQESWSLQTQASDGNFAPGDQVRVRLTIWSPRSLEHVLIEDHFPSNLEVTERGEANEDTSSDWDSWWSNTDVRDDRIAFFARRMSPGKHVIEYNLRAQTPGSGHALPTLVQEMYAPSVRAETGDTRISVQ